LAANLIELCSFCESNFLIDTAAGPESPSQLEFHLIYLKEVGYSLGLHMGLEIAG